jgi:hypothetical protein
MARANKKPPFWQPPKTWQPLKTWRPREWALMREVWHRLSEAGRSMSYIQHDLRQDFLNGDLIFAVRRLDVSDPERPRLIGVFSLKPAAWEPFRIGYAYLIEGLAEPVGEKWEYLVRRREFDQRYPAAATTEQQVGINPAKKQTEKAHKKQKHKGGRPRDYDHDAIEQLTENYIRDNGLPPTLSRLAEKVEHACNKAQPRIRVPQSTQFEAILRPIFQNRGRKLGNLVSEGKLQNRPSHRTK